jgi:hypothetical protein
VLLASSFMAEDYPAGVVLLSTVHRFEWSVQDKFPKLGVSMSVVMPG